MFDIPVLNQYKWPNSLLAYSSTLTCTSLRYHQPLKEAVYRKVFFHSLESDTKILTEYILCSLGGHHQQDRPLADWTDYFQSAPPRREPRATPTNLRKLIFLLKLRV